MRSELPRLGHEVTVCPDGKAALKALEKSTFDAAILDLRMPGLTGIEVLEQLKQIAPDTEAIVMTGHASMETAIEAVRLGAFDYLTKPCKLVESELFGHRKGAFTGADRDHKGLFEVANGGTLFLDEVGELNKNIQVKLLRFLEAGEIRRVGETEPFRTDVRVLCATNRDLRTLIKDDHFREDLYFRINTFEIR